MKLSQATELFAVARSSTKESSFDCSSNVRAKSLSGNSRKALVFALCLPLLLLFLLAFLRVFTSLLFLFVVRRSRQCALPYSLQVYSRNYLRRIAARKQKAAAIGVLSQLVDQRSHWALGGSCEQRRQTRRIARPCERVTERDCIGGIE